MNSPPILCAMTGRQSPLLSICIPTYNRCEYLRELLECLFGQLAICAPVDCEVCISDNASIDETKSIVAAFEARRVCCVRYERQLRNVGPHANIRHALSMGYGAFVWFLSDDDMLQFNALQRVLHYIGSACCPDLLVLNRFMASKSLVKFATDSYLKGEEDIDCDWSLETEFCHYISLARTVDAVGCFGSSLVLGRALLEKTLEESRDFYYDCWFPHTYAIWRAVSLRPHTRVRYVADPLIIWRADNSSCSAPEAEKCWSLLQASKKSGLPESVRQSLSGLILRHYHNSTGMKRMLRGAVSVSVVAGVMAARKNTAWLAYVLRFLYWPLRYTISAGDILRNRVRRIRSYAHGVISAG